MGGYNTAIKILKRAREILSKSWIKGAYATNANGLGVQPWSENAQKFCAVGAMQRAIFDVTGTRVSKDFYTGDEGIARKSLGETLGTVGIENWNDSGPRTHEQVLCAFDKTIVRLEDKEAANGSG